MSDSKTNFFKTDKKVVLDAMLQARRQGQSVRILTPEGEREATASDIEASIQRAGIDLVAGDDPPCMTVSEFREWLEHGPYTPDDEYPIYFMNADGDTLSFGAVKDNAGLVESSLQEITPMKWCLVEALVNWSNPNLCCLHTGAPIERAYAEEGEE